MTHKSVMALLSIVITAASATTAGAYGVAGAVTERKIDCRSLEEDDRESVLALYSYAALTEYAFKGTTYNCVDHPHQNEDEPHHISADVYLEPLFESDDEVVSWAEEGINGTVAYSTDDGAYILACQQQGLEVPIFIGFRIQRMLRIGTYYEIVARYNENEATWYVHEPKEGAEMIFSFQPFLAASPSIFSELSNLIGERIQTQRLRLVTPRTEHVEEDIVAIRGTQFTMRILNTLKELNASFQDIVDSSCAFSMAAILVRNNHDGFDANRLSITGHSLGGAVAQFVAYDRRKYPDLYRIKNFGAYAFNAIGIKEKMYDTLQDLISFRLQGDPLAGVLGPILGRDQAGVDVKCILPLSFGIERHGISEVQRALCGCIGGSGSAVFTSNRSGR